MPIQPHVSDYEPVTRPKRRTNAIQENPSIVEISAENLTSHIDLRRPDVSDESRPRVLARRGHALSYIGLVLFTFLLYFRPYEWSPELGWLLKSTFWTGLATVAIFFATELMLAGRLTALRTEVKLILLFSLIAIVSMVFAISPLMAWETFQEFLKPLLMFIVMATVLTSNRRLNVMFLLTIVVSCYLGFSGIRDYLTGKLVNDRVMGVVGNLFDNPNALALHLVTIIPIVVALLLSSRGLLKRFGFLLCVLVLVGAVFVSFSRGGFLGFGASMAFLVWKLRHRNRLIVAGFLALSVALLGFLIPSGQGLRILAIFSPSLDPTGSASQRQVLLWRSILVALRHPLLGIGIGNFPIMGVQALGTHNSYTQVAAEMGFAALVIYVAFMVVPFKGLMKIEQEAADDKNNDRYYYLAIGLQASLIGYMVTSFFAHVAYQWYVYYLVAYAISIKTIFDSRQQQTKLRPSTQ
jgi:O-antigen ligase